jgi:hypothetical protein
VELQFKLQFPLPGIPPTGVYHFKLPDQIKHLYRDPSFMENILWKFNGINKNGQRTFSELCWEK